jgi:uncharacterized RDD family membrane protein YckC
MSDPLNPYAPPQSAEAPPDYSQDEILLDASAGTRFANLIVDIICRMVFAFVLGFVLALAGLPLRDPFVNIAFSLLSLLLYYVGFEGLFGRTPGKFVTRTRVVLEDGSKPSLGTILLRTVCRFVPFEPFSFLGGSSRGWHDRWSGTRVVVIPK